VLSVASAANQACVCNCYSPAQKFIEVVGSIPVDNCVVKTPLNDGNCGEAQCNATFPGTACDLSVIDQYTTTNCVDSVDDTSIESFVGSYKVQPGAPCLPNPDGSLGACFPVCDTSACDCLTGDFVISAVGNSTTNFMVTVTADGHAPAGNATTPVTGSSTFMVTGPVSMSGMLTMMNNGSIFSNATRFEMVRAADGKQFNISVPSNKAGLQCNQLIILEGAEKVVWWKLAAFIGGGVVFLGFAYLFYRYCCSSTPPSRSTNNDGYSTMA
jgi:hypothetical protein